MSDELQDEWLKEHRQLQFLRTAGVISSSRYSKKKKMKMKGIAGKTLKQQMLYLSEREKKMREAQ